MEDKTPKNIESETSYQQVLRILGQQKKPSTLLCMLMNMLESYRQAKKMGWSRSWNKYGLTTFQSFKLEAEHDSALSEAALGCLKTYQPMPRAAGRFVEQLLTNPERLMGFLFFSEYREGEQDYETVTLSFGCKVDGNLRFRDRLDLVFDAAIVKGEPQALSRLRLYVDPYQEGKHEALWSATVQQEDIPDAFKALFASLAQLSWQWEAKQDKHWKHWTSRYIDYFGERNMHPAYSHFYTVSGKPLASRQAE